MTPIRNFKALLSHLSTKAERRRVAIANGYDSETLEAVTLALNAGFIDAIFVGRTPSPDLPELAPHAGHVRFVAAEGEDAAAAEAVRLVRNGEADFLMKGLIHTDNLLHAVLNKTEGILAPGAVLTHVTAAESAIADHMFFFTDAAVIPQPTLEQREAQVGYLAKICRAFGISVPRIALIHFTEKVSSKFPYTADCLQLKRMAEEGRWGAAIVDGPLDLRTSIDVKALRTKGIDSPIEGEADALVMPDLEAGNVLYKTLSLVPATKLAGTLCGTTAPVILSSRGDTAETKFLSMAFASML